jgi:hypothetical protein
VYNPCSIALQLARLHDAAFVFSESDTFQNNEIWHSFEHHSAFDDTDKTAFLARINAELVAARAYLAKADTLLITLGTAQIHEYIAQKPSFVVANCHKLPQTNFATRRLTVGETVAALLPILQKIQHEKPNLRVIFTVSPVRYLREGLVQSARSKATLLLATELLCANLRNAHYFPAYEYLIDDLRDYRFFADDMLHPNDLAIGYIWEKMTATYFDTATLGLCTRFGKARKMLAHRPFQTDTDAYRAFRAKAEAEWLRLIKVRAS